MRLSADVQPLIEPRDDVGQANGVDVEDHRGVGIVADGPGIAGHQHEVAHAHGMRAKQI